MSSSHVSIFFKEPCISCKTLRTSCKLPRFQLVGELLQRSQCCLSLFSIYLSSSTKQYQYLVPKTYKWSKFLRDNAYIMWQIHTDIFSPKRWVIFVASYFVNLYSQGVESTWCLRMVTLKLTCRLHILEKLLNWST